MLSRHAVLIGALATAVGRPRLVRAQASPEPAPGDKDSPPVILQLQRRVIEVNGKPASVFGIRQPDGTSGLVTDVGKRFRVRVESWRPIF